MCDQEAVNTLCVCVLARSSSRLQNGMSRKISGKTVVLIHVYLCGLVFRCFAIRRPCSENAEFDTDVLIFRDTILFATIIGWATSGLRCERKYPDSEVPKLVPSRRNKLRGGHRNPDEALKPKMKRGRRRHDLQVEIWLLLEKERPTGWSEKSAIYIEYVLIPSWKSRLIEEFLSLGN